MNLPVRLLSSTVALLAATGSLCLCGCHKDAPVAAVPSASVGAAAAMPSPVAGQFQVWADPATKSFFYPGMPKFGKTSGGQYMSEAQARASGYTPMTHL